MQNQTKLGTKDKPNKEPLDKLSEESPLPPRPNTSQRDTKINDITTAWTEQLTTIKDLLRNLSASEDPPSHTETQTPGKKHKCPNRRRKTSAPESFLQVRHRPQAAATCKENFRCIFVCRPFLEAMHLKLNHHHLHKAGCVEPSQMEGKDGEIFDHTAWRMPTRTMSSQDLVRRCGVVSDLALCCCVVAEFKASPLTWNEEANKKRNN